MNPAAAVRGPKHVVTKGATPVLSPAEARKLLESIDTGTLAGLRDRALLCWGMRRRDYFGQGSRGWLRLHEKGGKRHDVPAHHRAVAGPSTPTPRRAGSRSRRRRSSKPVDPAGRLLTGRALERRVALAMIKRCASAAGLPPSTCCHTFRVDGDHGVPVERWDARARTADRGARVAEDDEAPRPDGGHGDGRRDRTHRGGTGPRCGSTGRRTPWHNSTRWRMRS